MAQLHVGVEDSRGLKIPGAFVITDDVWGNRIGEATADADGVADMDIILTPFGTYRNKTTTPLGFKAEIEWKADVLGNPPAVLLIHVKDSKEGSYAANVKASVTKNKPAAIVLGAGALIVGAIAYGISSRKRQESQQLMLLASLRAPQETVNTMLKNGGFLTKKKKVGKHG